MIGDILNTDKKYITQDLVSYISTKLGERHCSIHVAISSCIPIIFSGILIKSTETSSIEPILKLITSKQRINSDFLYKPNQIYADNEKILKKGKKNFILLFGQKKVTEIIDEIKRTSGIKFDSAKTLLEITTAITIATLGIKANSEGWKTNELLNYLIRHQKDIKNSTPSKIKEILQMDDTVIKEKSTVVTSETSNRKKYWVKYVILAVLAIVIIFLVKNGCSNQVKKSFKKQTISLNTTLLKSSNVFLNKDQTI